MMKYHSEEQCLVKLKAIEEMAKNLKNKVDDPEVKMIIENIEQTLIELKRG